MKYNKDLKPFVTKAQEDLNPLDVLRIFENIIAEDVELMNMDPKVYCNVKIVIHLVGKTREVNFNSYFGTSSVY
jgi:hypothetical protein